MQKLLLVALLGSALSAYAQRETPKPAAPEQAYIEVTGTASREVVPDRIFLRVVLKSLPTDKPQRPVPQQEAELRRVVAQQGIGPALLTLADASSELVAARRRKAPEAEVRKEYLLQLGSAAQLASVVQALQAAGLPDASVERTEYSQLESLQKEVRIAALRAARDKATYLLQAIGEQPDRPVAIREVPAYAEGYRPALLSNTVLSGNSVAALDDAPEGEGDTAPPVRFASLKVSFSYYVRYSLK